MPAAQPTSARALLVEDTLLPILNTDRVPREFRNRWHTNTALVITTVVFVALGIYQLINALKPLFGG